MHKENIENYSKHKLLREVRLELAIRKYIDRNNYVKAKQIAGITDYNPQEVSRALEILEHRGEIEKWSDNTGLGSTYEILL